MLVDKSLWTEKYRPKTIDQLNCSSHIKKFLENSLENGFPHLLFYGPPGTGKTTCASILKPTLELNASDDRGIEIIRNKIKKIANTIAPQIILLDECENLTKDSQTCLRRILEDYPNTRFIFCTNYFNKIIDPLKSRLLKIKFTIKEEGNSLETIGKHENMDFDIEFYKELFKKCEGDLRKCLNVLQGIKPLKSFNLDNILGRIENKILENFYKISLKNYENFLQNFIFEGYSVLQLVKQLSCNLRGTDKEKSEFSKILAECEGKLVIGCSEEIVLRFLCLGYLLLNN